MAASAAPERRRLTRTILGELGSTALRLEAGLAARTALTMTSQQANAATTATQTTLLCLTSTEMAPVEEPAAEHVPTVIIRQRREYTVRQ